MEIVWGRTAPNVFLAVMDVVATLLFIRVGVRACVCLFVLQFLFSVYRLELNTEGLLGFHRPSI